MKVSNMLRVVHFPQVETSKPSFNIAVKDEEQALFCINTLANQHLYLFENNIIPDYSNSIFVEMYDTDINEDTGNPIGWCNYWNDKESLDWDDVVEILGE